MTKTFTAPDGRALVVDGMDDIGLKWSSVVELDGSRGKTRLFTAPVGSNRMVEEALGIIGGKIVRSVSAGSVKLTSIEDPETKTTMFLRESEDHELYVNFAGTAIPFENFQALIGRLKVSDSPAGLVVQSNDHSACRHLMSVSAPEGLGASVVARPRGAAGTERVSGRGQAVRGGELWNLPNQEGDGEGVSHILLMNESTYVTFSYRGAPTDVLSNAFRDAKFELL